VREVVPAALDGERVDRAVALLTGLSRSEVADLVVAGAVSLTGHTIATRSRRVRTGDVLEVEVPARAAPASLVAESGVAVPVVHADDQVIVVDKPAGLVVHPGAGHANGTLVHGLLSRFPDLADLIEPGPDRDRPGIVHRLDKGTSGLLVVARTGAARDALIAQLAARAVDRRYAALVWGRVEAAEGLIDAPLGRADNDPTRVAVRAGGREARTRYAVERRYAGPGEPGQFTLLECRLETGRTHQIRVHLAAVGHPVVGDPRYGAKRGAGPAMTPGRQWLHARQLSFDHPATGARLTFASALPADLSSVLAGLT
jgi:23S rRNA pseudouridine1911/1915/1917 synthase